MKVVKVGDRIIVSPKHRLAREEGEIVAIGDNKEAEYNHYHVLFDRDNVFGTIGGKEIWLCRTDFDVVE